MLITKDINIELNELLKIREQVLEINKFLLSNPHAVVLSKSRYDDFFERNELDKNTIYLVVDKKVGQYIAKYLA